MDQQDQQQQQEHTTEEVDQAFHNLAGKGDQVARRFSPRDKYDTLVKVECPNCPAVFAADDQDQAEAGLEDHRQHAHGDTFQAEADEDQE